MESRLASGAHLAASITRAASKQTFYTIRFLVDGERVEDAFRAYAYFRWVDDWLDQELRPRDERLAFVRRQQELIERCLAGGDAGPVSPEEEMLVDLIRNAPERNCGLMTYIRNMMAVMAFDADRRGRLISQQELNDYTYWLASAVTEAMHYFIGHACASPAGRTRYLAVTGAHITHMLRDHLEDVSAGYFNLPLEAAETHGRSLEDAESQPSRAWIKSRVQQARDCFKAGREYMAQVECLRCRIAGYAYMRRFEEVLDTIEADGYQLNAHYTERAGLRHGIGMLVWALWMALTRNRPFPASSAIPAR